MTELRLHNHVGLNNFECRLIELIAQGLTTGDIAKLLKIALGVADTYRFRLIKKVGVKNSCELVSWAYRNRVLLVEEEIDVVL